MALCTADFELGTNGNAIQTSDPGSATAWNTIVNAGAGNIVAYDNAHVAHGALAAKIDTNSTPGNSATLQWDAALGTVTDWYGRAYLYTTVNPAASFRIGEDATNGSWLIWITSAGKLLALDSLGAVMFTSTNSVALNAWFRVEWHMIHSTTVGQYELKLFNSPDSTTPTEVDTSTATFNTGASCSAMLFGLVAGGSGGGIWLDNLVAGATSYPGPAVAPSTSNPILRLGRGSAW
jgi:hypothetical protein